MRDKIGGLFILFGLLIMGMGIWEQLFEEIGEAWQTMLIGGVLVAVGYYVTTRRTPMAVERPTDALTAATQSPPDSVAAVSAIKGDLGAFSPEQWRRVLPEKPGRVVYGHPDKSGPAKLSKINDVAKCIDCAIDACCAGGFSREVEEKLLEASALMPLPFGDGDLDYVSYGEDQRFHMMKIIDQLREVLAVAAEKDQKNPRYRILSAAETDVRELSVSNMDTAGGWQDRLIARFSDDPRVFDLEWNSGYHYTTGVSSGSAAQAEADGEIEVGNFSMKCIADDYNDILEAFNKATER